MKKSTMESLSLFPSSKVSTFICKTVTSAKAAGVGNTATTQVIKGTEVKSKSIVVKSTI